MKERIQLVDEKKAADVRPATPFLRISDRVGGAGDRAEVSNDVEEFDVEDLWDNVPV